jgi:hypothetical protein
MSSLPRLLESGSEFEAKLLRSAKSERPSRAGMKRAVAAASTVALGTCAGVATKSGLITAKAASWMAGIGACVGIAGIGVAVLASSPAGPVRAPALERTSIDAPPTSAPPAVAPIAPTASVVPEAPRVAVTAPTAVKPRSPTASSPAPAQATPVEDELTLLRRAKARIAANDPQGALETLDAYAKAYPKGTFGEEAAALRVEAFVATGDRARAQSAADAFLERHPESPYAQRIRSAVSRIPP